MNENVSFPHTAAKPLNTPPAVTAARTSRMFQRMVSGELYYAGVDEIRIATAYGRELADLYNATPRSDEDKRRAIIRALFGSVGENCHIEANIRVDYGCNIHVGDGFYANVDCVFLDVAPIRCGDNCLLGPNVRLIAACHPLDPQVRATGLELGKPISIGSNVWLGASVTVNPGVTIGDNVVIGSGAVVTRDIPSNCIAAGIPCRPLRSICADESADWQRQADDFRAEFPDIGI